MPAVLLNDLAHSGHWKQNEGWFLRVMGWASTVVVLGLPLFVRGVET